MFIVYPSSHVPPEHVVSTLLKALVREHVYLVAFADPTAILWDFLAGGFLTVPEIQHLEWVWLLFPGAKYVCPFIFDPFAFLTRMQGSLVYVWSTAIEHRLPRGIDDNSSFMRSAMLTSHWTSSASLPSPGSPSKGFHLPDGFVFDPSFELMHLPTFRDGGYLDFYRKARPAAPSSINLQDLCILRTAGVAQFITHTQVYQLGTLTGHTTLKARTCYEQCSSTHPDCASSFDHHQLLGKLKSALRPSAGLDFQVLDIPPFAALPFDISSTSLSTGFSIDDETFTVLLVGWFLLMSVCLLIVFFLCLACYSARMERRPGPLPSRIRRPVLSRTAHVHSSSHSV